ncbi:MAG: hypothetical protein QF830_12785, partial [Rhodospirillales bacterium]|nr:hypothetical protein [Rhodospirillales bacterium]
RLRAALLGAGVLSPYQAAFQPERGAAGFAYLARLFVDQVDHAAIGCGERLYESLAAAAVIELNAAARRITGH